jgi:hypothetical protein
VTPNGKTLVVGITFFDGSGGNDSGAAWVFEEEGGRRIETMLQPSDSAAFDYFGRSVAISDDGRLVAIGAHGDDTPTVNSGSVRIFVKNGPGSWLEQATLISKNPAHQNNFGFAVALSGDGTRVLVGERFAGQPAVNYGAAHVYHRQGDQWLHEAALNPELPAQAAGFGYDVAITTTGNRVIVGAPSAGNGATIVFDRTGSTWSLQKKFQSPPEAAAFGNSVDISGDGATVLIGAPLAPSAPLYDGTAFVAHFDNGKWTELIPLTSCHPSQNGLFGGAVGISAQGDLAMVGAPWRAFAGGIPPVGATHVYQLKSGTWRRVAELLPRQIHDDLYMGAAMDFASLTNQLFVGAPGDGLNNLGPGSVLQLNPNIQCFGDLDGNLTIDVNDLLALIGAWGPCGLAECPGDFDSNGMVNVVDLLIMIEFWSCLTAN